MQIRHDRCVNCNECSIARTCPSNAISGIPASIAYLPKDEQEVIKKSINRKVHKVLRTKVTKKSKKKLA